jgi:hypothetical protein
MAANNGHIEVVRVLLAAGAEVNAKNNVSVVYDILKVESFC